MIFGNITHHLPELVNVYSASHRYYHNLAHITRMFDIAKERSILLDEELIYAIWFHDYVYHIPSGGSSNEEQSAVIAYQKCKDEGRSESFAKSVYYMIMDTEKELPTCTCKSAILIDLDLWDLSIYDRFSKNSRLIKKEFVPTFSETVYLENRIKWIDSFLARDSIFVSEYATLAMERNARYNLKREREYCELDLKQ